MVAIFRKAYQTRQEWGATGMLVVFCYDDAFNDVFLRKFTGYTLMICILLCKYI